jgi:hypothetical protein
MNVHEQVLSSMHDMAERFSRAGVKLQLPPPSNTTLGTRYTDIDAGRMLAAEVSFDPKFNNPMGVFQGGFLQLQPMLRVCLKTGPVIQSGAADFARYWRIRSCWPTPGAGCKNARSARNDLRKPSAHTLLPSNGLAALLPRSTRRWWRGSFSARAFRWRFSIFFRAVRRMTAIKGANAARNPGGSDWPDAARAAGDVKLCFDSCSLSC